MVSCFWAVLYSAGLDSLADGSAGAGKSMRASSCRQAILPTVRCSSYCAHDYHWLLWVALSLDKPRAGLHDVHVSMWQVSLIRIVGCATRS